MTFIMQMSHCRNDTRRQMKKHTPGYSPTWHCSSLCVMKKYSTTTKEIQKKTHVSVLNRQVPWQQFRCLSKAGTHAWECPFFMHASHFPTRHMTSWNERESERNIVTTSMSHKQKWLHEEMCLCPRPLQSRKGNNDKQFAEKCDSIKRVLSCETQGL